MLIMENAEEVMQILERFTRLKQKEIPKELDDYLHYVAKTGDTIFKWTSLKYLFREKLLNVIKHFHDTTPRVDEIPQYPNVDPFNYENMKSSLLERLELFNAAPFTIQRLCELLIDPRKQYSRIDKFMRALEKNILVSTIEPGRKRSESENGDSLDSVVNGDLSLDVNVDIDMENESLFNIETQNGNGSASASEQASTHKNVEDTESKEMSASEPLKVDHTNDDEALPNPKKAKLDLDDEKKANEKDNNELNKEEIKLNVEEKAKEETKCVEEISVTCPEQTQLVQEPADSSIIESSPKIDAVADIKQKEEISTDSVKVDDVKDEKKLEVKSDEIEVTAAHESIVHSENDPIGEGELKGNEKELKESVDEPETVVSFNEADSEKSNIVGTNSVAEAPKEVTSNSNKGIVKSKTDVTAESTSLADEGVAEKIIEKHVPNELETIEKTIKKSDVDQSEAKPDDREKDKSVDISEKSALVKEDTLAADEIMGKIAHENFKKEAASKVSDNKEKTEVDVVPAKTANIDDIISSTSGSEKTEIPALEEAAKTVIDASLTPEIDGSITKNELIATIPADIDIPLDTNIGVADIEPSVNSTSTPEEAVVAVEANALPVLTLNDQPMEDIPLEEAVATVEEVIMSENGGGTEMATDANEPSKEEPTGMDVDDTSQEAMDQ